MTKKCLFTFFSTGGRWSSDFVKTLAAHDIEVKANTLGRWYTEDELIEELKDVDAVLAGGDPYTARVMESCKKLKIIARIGVGYDHVDLRAATANGIYVTWTPIPELAKSVADEAFALMLSVLHRAPTLDKHVREGGYDIEGMAAHVLDMYPLSLGILGLGKVGIEVAKRAKGFGMRVMYHDVVRREDVEKEMGLQYVTKERLFRESDIISVHTPLTEETRKSVGKKEIAMMKNSAILINTSRGPVVDELALYDALAQGMIGGAGLSVLEEEPPSAKSPFYKLGEKLPNLVLFPHMGAGIQTGRALIDAATNDVIAALEGREPMYVLNKDVLTSPSKGLLPRKMGGHLKP